MACVMAAGWNEVAPLFTELKAQLGKDKDMTDEAFWKVFARGDLPQKVLDALETKVPGSATAKRGDAKMTEAMNQRATYHAFRIANIIARNAAARAVGKTTQADKYALEMADAAKKLVKLEREFRDANAQDQALAASLREMIKEMAVGMDRGLNASFAAGKLAGAIREIEGLTEDEAIPESYQKVFKQVLDNGVSLMDYASAVALLDLPLGNMRVPEIVKAIEDNAVRDARLQKLVENRPLMVALASLARDNTRQMDLLQLRSLKNHVESAAIIKELEEIRTANDERLEEMGKVFTEARTAQGLRDRLRAEYLRVRRDYRRAERTVTKAEESARINRGVAERLRAKAVELSKEVGAFSYWEPVNGATYLAMQLGEDGQWRSVTRTLQMQGGEIAGQHEQVRSDLVANRQWLAANEDQKGIFTRNLAAC